MRKQWQYIRRIYYETNETSGPFTYTSPFQDPGKGALSNVFIRSYVFEKIPNVKIFKTPSVNYCRDVSGSY
jgi:hypothetical protein